ncbi:glycoside hydrolase family 1 protein [Candidatus Daviesbacteria bacterium]|nr:glycoside hydrolase family 1 protein [Candidatus Daviesbacteria bacterium]MBI4038057.1 glycoside hydrolase family 1 protein [Candidatus Daviesbacteria bacterium]
MPQKGTAPQKHPQERHDHETLKFPDGFLWGAATSAHQVEGNNVNNDWWAWEQTQQPPHLRSGAACNQYNLFEQDFDLIKSLNHNAHRLSIEWSRIEPREGEFDEREIEHYVKLLKYLKSLKFTVMLTLWHFTLPKWVADKGGWENGATVGYFERFARRVVPEIATYVDLWVTLNEPGVYIYETYIDRVWPHSKKSWLGQIKTFLNLTSAHKRAYKYLHSLFPAGKPVGIANNILSFESYHKHSFKEQIAVSLNDLFANHLFYMFTRGTHDFLGINYYFHIRFRDKNLTAQKQNMVGQTHDASDLGWEVYPEGIFEVLTDLADDIPIYITECGIASTNDDRRNRFLISYLQEVARAIKSGVNVRGFFYWSLLDNFEWHLGFEPKFGLVEVDLKTQARHIRPSALVYTDIIQHNGIPHSLLRFIGHTVQAEEVLEKRQKEIEKEINSSQTKNKSDD